MNSKTEALCASRPGTTVDFSEFSLRSSGARSSALNLQTGTAYLDFRGGKSAQEFSLNFGNERLPLTRPAHLRVALKNDNATLAVFKGDVEAEGSSGKVEVEKKHSATFDLTGANPYTLANNLEPDPYDDWDKQQEKYHEQYSASAGNSYSPYSYGSSDLNYYGSFYSIPGYGMMWQPYLVGAGWDPFMNGAWMWYRVGVHVGIFLSLGLDAVPVWILDLPVELRLVLATRRNMGGMEQRSPGHEPSASIRFPQTPRYAWTDAGCKPQCARREPRCGSNRIELRSGSAGLGVPRGSCLCRVLRLFVTYSSNFATSAVPPSCIASRFLLTVGCTMPSSSVLADWLSVAASSK